MVYVFAGLIVIALAVLAIALVLQSRVIERLLNLIGEQSQRGQDERRELINRAQFPDRMPTKPTGQATVQSNLSPESRRALAQVGKIAPQRLSDGD